MKATLIAAALAASLVLLWGCKAEKPVEPGGSLAGLTPEQEAQFAQGKQTFQRVFNPTNGLGPLFNANSCAQCHEAPVTGGVGDEVEVHATRFRPPNLCDPLFEEGGPVFEINATPRLQAYGIT